jgi:hypothetical protein
MEETLFAPVPHRTSLTRSTVTYKPGDPGEQWRARRPSQPARPIPSAGSRTRFLPFPPEYSAGDYCVARQPVTCAYGAPGTPS